MLSKCCSTVKRLRLFSLNFKNILLTKQNLSDATHAQEQQQQCSMLCAVVDDEDEEEDDEDDEDDEERI